MCKYFAEQGGVKSLTLISFLYHSYTIGININIERKQTAILKRKKMFLSRAEGLTSQGIYIPHKRKKEKGK